jgi:hypothetical protein
MLQADETAGCRGMGRARQHGCDAGHAFLTEFHPLRPKIAAGSFQGADKAFAGPFPVLDF